MIWGIIWAQFPILPYIMPQISSVYPKASIAQLWYGLYTNAANTLNQELIRQMVFKLDIFLNWFFVNQRKSINILENYLCIFVLVSLFLLCNSPLFFFLEQIVSNKRCLHLQLEVPWCCNGLVHSLFKLTCILKTSFAIFRALLSPEYGNYFYFCDIILT